MRPAGPLGLGPKEIEKALRSFAGLPHRSQLVGKRGGVRFINDSKATNVDSAAKALQAFPRIRWIAGGLGKEGGIAGLLPYLGSVQKAYLIGHSARDFALEIGDTPHEICETMERAVARAALARRCRTRRCPPKPVHGNTMVSIRRSPPCRIWSTAART